MPKKSKANQPDRTTDTLAAFGIPPLDYAPFLARENWWTYELVHLVTKTYLPVPEVPEHPLAYHYDESFGDEDKNPEDYLENELRNAFDRRDSEIPIVQDSVERTGHRSIKRVDGLRFVQRHMDAINAKVMAKWEREESTRLEMIRTGGTYKIYDLETGGIINAPPREAQPKPILIFIPDELRPLLKDFQGDGPRTECAATEERATTPSTGDVAEHGAAVTKQSKGYYFEYGGVGVAVPKSDGFRYICELLRRPYKNVEALTLYTSDRVPLSKEDKIEAEAYRRGSFDLNANSYANRRRANISPEESRLVSKLREQAKEATEEGDEDTAQDLRKQALAIANPTEPKPERKKAADAVRSTIKYALRLLEKDHSTLYKHLSDSINFGTKLIYRPAENPNWSIK